MIGVIVAQKFCSQVSVSWKTISCETAKTNSVKHGPFWQGTCVQDAINSEDYHIVSFSKQKQQLHLYSIQQIAQQ